VRRRSGGGRVPPNKHGSVASGERGGLNRQVWATAEPSTGYSSLNYRRRLPIDTLKIDRSFVHDIDDEDEGEGILAQAIISLSHSLKLKVIAEGVETDAQLKFLRMHRCDEVQGYYFSKPLPAGEYAHMLAAEYRWKHEWPLVA